MSRKKSLEFSIHDEIRWPPDLSGTINRGDVEVFIQGLPFRPIELQRNMDPIWVVDGEGVSPDWFIEDFIFKRKMNHLSKEIK